MDEAESININLNCYIKIFEPRNYPKAEKINIWFS